MNSPILLPLGSSLKHQCLLLGFSEPVIGLGLWVEEASKLPKLAGLSPE